MPNQYLDKSALVPKGAIHNIIKTLSTRHEFENFKLTVKKIDDRAKVLELDNKKFAMDLSHIREDQQRNLSV